MTMHVKVGGVWKTISVPSIKVGGAWKTVQGGWVRVGGVWKQFYQNLSATLSPTYGVTVTAIQPSDAYVTIRVDSDGYIYEGRGTPTISYTQGNQWIGGGVNSEYECRWTNVSGTLSAGTAGIWTTLINDVQFTRSNTTNGFSTNTCVGTLEIRMAASPYTVLATSTVTLEAVTEI